MVKAWSRDWLWLRYLAKAVLSTERNLVRRKSLRSFWRWEARAEVRLLRRAAGVGVSAALCFLMILASEMLSGSTMGGAVPLRDLCL